VSTLETVVIFKETKRNVWSKYFIMIARLWQYSL